ncbi:autorepressor SdpR family transcription factor [Lactobacillus xylocopicola]|uniref:Transcriptional regulator n=1 Tax=Lactobacillus xylocopicola TaxID=2976676 RepID=A0ABN6SNT5_9LACO|nr:autorepressor SdpR family transcription factor [Lactobacillus xylocopicola]BDR60867.1 transcriptional regulator [Lactobacillus xylocopicola]
MRFEVSFKALADPARRKILQLLKHGSMSAGEIASHFEMTQATVSYHLNVLKKADLICEERQKNFIYYSLNTSILEEIMAWLVDLKGNQDEEK